MNARQREEKEEKKERKLSVCENSSNIKTLPRLIKNHYRLIKKLAISEILIELTKIKHTLNVLIRLSTHLHTHTQVALWHELVVVKQDFFVQITVPRL